MSKKAHGTSDIPVQATLRWQCDPKLADKICNFNRRFAEEAGYWQSKFTPQGETTFFDSNSQKPLFHAPRGRTLKQFEVESKDHGWPSFRDEEVYWENMRVLEDGECVSVDGTHLGHNLPDRHGNRYCINLVSVAAFPKAD
jgi:peptide methionine sulfoxide reductase MsrB